MRVVMLIQRFRPDFSGQGEQVEVLCREHLVPYKVPVAFHYVDELPRSEVGKVLRRDLAARVASDSP